MHKLTEEWYLYKKKGKTYFLSIKGIKVTIFCTFPHTTVLIIASDTLPNIIMSCRFEFVNYSKLIIPAYTLSFAKGRSFFTSDPENINKFEMAMT